jgi:hypothetical protein
MPSIFVANRLKKRGITRKETPLYQERDEEQRQEYLDQLNFEVDKRV